MFQNEDIYNLPTADNSGYAVRYCSPKCSVLPRTSHTRRMLAEIPHATIGGEQNDRKYETQK